MLMTLVRFVVFLLGLGIVLATFASAIRTLVLPRGARDFIAGTIFEGLRRTFDVAARQLKTYQARDALMAFYAPVALLMLPPTWLLLIATGFTCMYWASGIADWWDAFVISGSSLLTLGFAKGDSFLQTHMEFAEATIGLVLIALLIAYLPTIYNAFSRRELAVTMLEVRAGSPPSAIEMISRFQRLHRLEQLHEVWERWETWFAEVEESHTSLPALVFFRSPQSEHSWITAAGAVLDTAALVRSAVDTPTDVQADLCIRAGYLALRRIADFFQVPYNANPSFPEDPISIQRQEFDQAYEQLASAGVPMTTDREQAWKDFAGWRVNYDTVLLAICKLTMAPYAPWSSDRSLLVPPGDRRS